MTTAFQNAPVLTVSQFTNAVKLQLESSFPQVWIQGEISNCKLQTSGHLYFSLKDAGATVSAVMFKSAASTLKIVPKDGNQVIIFGELSVYPPQGKYQITVRELRQVGLGELLVKLEELKIKLNRKGYFKTDRKKPLPKFPKRIGVVTSPTGAVIQDILNVLNRRFAGFHLILNPVKVQGEGAAQEIAKAIEFFNAHNLVDVMIVGRGGGSIEDLWAFNEELLADAIYNSRIPIISAVGHETDHCIADYVADVRAPTPSAAAEIVSAEASQQLHHLSQMRQRIQQSLVHLTRHHRQLLARITRHPIFATPYALLGPWMQKLDDFRRESDRTIDQLLERKKMQVESAQKQALAFKPGNLLLHHKQQIQQWQRSLDQTMCAIVESKRKQLNAPVKLKQLQSQWDKYFQSRCERVQQISSALHSINPKNLLGKGYSILFSQKEGSVIKSIESTSIGEEIKILLYDGTIQAIIKEKNSSDK